MIYREGSDERTDYYDTLPGNTMRTCTWLKHGKELLYTTTKHVLWQSTSYRYGYRHGWTIVYSPATGKEVARYLYAYGREICAIMRKRQIEAEKKAVMESEEYRREIEQGISAIER